MKAVVLLSGGLDSATVLAIAKAEGRACYALSFAYGQRHGIELDAARRVAGSLGVDEHVVFPMDLRLFGGSALTGDIDVPKDVADAPGIPVTYVPARNTIFLSLALGYAEAREAQEIWIGVNAIDFSGYPDCRPEFLEAFQKMANLATKVGVEGTLRFQIHAPLLRMTKREIVTRASGLGLDFALTSSCYDPSGEGAPCGACDSCILREKGFLEAGVPDPIR